MNVLDVSYLTLGIASAFGAVLFIGFTFRVKVHYPVALINTHLLMIAVTCILLTIHVVSQVAFRTVHGFNFALMLMTYALFLVTFITGMSFYLKFNVKRFRSKRRPPRARWVSTHLIMATVTFIFYTTYFIDSLPSPPPPRHLQVGANSPRWNNFHLHQTVRALHAAASAQNGL